MKTTTIRKRMIILFGSLLLIAFFVVFLFSRIALELYMNNQLKDDFEEEISIITSVFKEEFLDSEGDSKAPSVIENFRSGKRRVGYFELDSSIEIVTIVNDKVRVLTTDNTIETADHDTILRIIENESFGDILTVNREVNGESLEFKVYVAPINLNKTAENRFYVIMYVPVHEEVAALQRFSRILSLILLVVYIITMLGVFLIATRLTKPIKQMKAFANSIGSGEEAKEISINTRDELSDLGHTLNVMAKDIKNANEEQLRFLQNASHELKTPLTSIQGYAEGLIDGVVTEEGEALEIIIEESIRLKKIVNQLSLLSKLETGVKTYKHEEVDLLKCVQDVVNRLNLKEMNSVKINIITDSGDNYSVLGDYDGFIQSFLNVLSNGLRYAHEVIEVKLVKQGSQIEVIFTDDGLGIKENAIPHLFERFYKGNKGDTGLGLAIVKAITDQQNGTIEVYNSSDKGAVFKFLFPII